MTHNMPTLPRFRIGIQNAALAMAALLWVLPLAAQADAARSTMWELHGPRNTVFVLGSIHMLRPEDGRLPTVALTAYARAGALLMEVDPVGIGAQRDAPEIRALSVLPKGQLLGPLIGARRYAYLQRLATTLGLMPDFLAHLQPWYAATVLDSVYLMRLGFDPDLGVDMQLALQAKRDGKPILELESVAEQFGFFASMSMAEQRAYLNDTLLELPSSGVEALAAVHAWQSGDVPALEKQLRKGRRDSPRLQDTLTRDRNRRWLPRIVALLQDDRDYLVVVGALHLVGRDGLIALLQKQGYEAQQR